MPAEFLIKIITYIIVIYVYIIYIIYIYNINIYIYMLLAYIYIYIYTYSLVIDLEKYISDYIQIERKMIAMVTDFLLFI